MALWSSGAVGEVRQELSRARSRQRRDSSYKTERKGLGVCAEGRWRRRRRVEAGLRDGMARWGSGCDLELDIHRRRHWSVWDAEGRGLKRGFEWWWDRWVGLAGARSPCGEGRGGVTRI